MSLRVAGGSGGGGGGRSSPAQATCPDCHVCGDESRSPILTCSACKTSVHAACYGVNQLNNGRWLCDVCTWRAENNGKMQPPTCCLCSKPGGAMKQCEVEGREDNPEEGSRVWAHLLCVYWDGAVWINSEDLSRMGPIRFNHRRLRAPAVVSPELTCVVCKQSGSLTVCCNHSGCRNHVHPSCARNNPKAYICTESSMGHFFCSAFCPSHGGEGLTGLTLLEDLRSQVPDLLEKVIGGGLRQVARSMKVCKKVDIVYERLHSGSFYRHPKEMAQDFEKLLRDLPDAGEVLEEFDRKYARWVRGMLPKETRPTDAGSDANRGLLPLSGGASPLRSKRQVGDNGSLDGDDPSSGSLTMYQDGYGKKAGSRAASSAMNSEEPSKRRKQDGKTEDCSDDYDVAWKEDDGGGAKQADDLDFDVVCEVCREGEALLDDNIVACDGCDVPVHQSCYGIEEVPEGDWFCARCLAERKGALEGINKECYFCGLGGGAMKSTQDGKTWGHVSCVWAEPDAYFSDALLMEPIVFRRKIPPPIRKVGPCCFCNRTNVGACIQCRSAECKALFHTQCAKDHGGLIKIDQHLGALLTQTYCSEHKDGRVDPWEIMRGVRVILDPTPTVKTIESIEGKLGRQTYQTYDAWHRDMGPVLQALEEKGAKEVHSDVTYRMSVLRDFLKGKPAKRKNE